MQKLIETLGDKFFLLREKLDRALHRKPAPKSAEPAKKKEPFSWKRLRDPKEIRNLMNEYNVVVSLLAIVMTAVAGWYLYKTAFPQSYVQNFSVYYYDLKTGELFSGPTNQVPPIETPSKSMIGDQPAGVRAHVLSCGECSDAKSRFTAYLESFTPEGKKAMLDPVVPPQQGQGPPIMMPDRDQGHIVRGGDMKGDWVSATSKEGIDLVMEAMRKCNEPDKFPRECLPGSK